MLLKGFTLSELLIVLGLIVLIVGFSAALDLQSLRFQEFDRARDIVRSELTAARDDTIAGTGDAAWGAAFTSSTITRFQGANYASRNTAFDDQTTFPAVVTISGMSEIDFTRPDGVPVAAGSIIVSVNGRYATITVSAVGGIDVQ